MLALGWFGTVAALPQPVITEFMARNQSSLADGYGGQPDWIEIHNPTAEPVSLEGFYLTDDLTEPRRWRLPSVVLEPGAYWVVFASGRDEQDPAGHWHTNFRLAGDGEQLALVAPDGRTVLSRFPAGGGSFPPQRDDVSYGLEEKAVKETFIGRDTPSRWHVADAATWASAWNRPGHGFDDAGWQQGLGALGFETGPTAGNLPVFWWAAEEREDNHTPDAMGRYPLELVDAEVVATAAGHALAFDGEDDYAIVPNIPELRAPGAFTLSLWFNRSVDHAGGGADSNHRINNILLAHSSNADNDNLEIGTEGSALEFYFDTVQQDGPNPSLRIEAGIQNGRWYHLVLTYDRTRPQPVAIYLDGERLGQFAGWGGGFDVSEAPLTLGLARPDRQLWGDFQGYIDDVALWTTALDDDAVRALHQRTPPPELAGLRGAIRTDVAAAMAGGAPGLLVRYPFEVADPDAFAKWRLRVRHDAGLVVWLNGVEILRRLTPEPAGWDATATAERPDQEALQWIEVPLATSPPIAPGGNLLAVHALNSDPADEDLLVEVELEGEGPVQTREAYFPAPTPGASNGSGVAGFVEPVRFSVPRGFYDEPFEVELDCP
ncbi:MAG: hypothetical protein D6766_05645, partial [Verrucomicrobia bacterium]